MEMDKQTSILSETSLTKDFQNSQLSLKPIHALETSLCFTKDTNTSKHNISFNTKAQRLNKEFVNPDELYTPGPADYNSIFNIKNTNFVESEYAARNKRMAPFGTTTNRFAIFHKGLGPGPTTYSLQQNSLEKGRSTIFSQNKNILRNSFLMLAKENFPGPGRYNQAHQSMHSYQKIKIKRKHAHQILLNLNCVMKRQALLPQKKNKQQEIRKQQQKIMKSVLEQQFNRKKNKQLNLLKSSTQKLDRFAMRDQTEKFLKLQKQNINSRDKFMQINEKIYQRIDQAGFSYFLKEKKDKAYQSYIKVDQNPGPGFYFRKEHDKCYKQQRQSPVFFSKVQKGNCFIQSVKLSNNNHILSYIDPNQSFAKKTGNLNHNKRWL